MKKIDEKLFFAETKLTLTDNWVVNGLDISCKPLFHLKYVTPVDICLLALSSCLRC